MVKIPPRWRRYAVLRKSCFPSGPMLAVLLNVIVSSFMGSSAIAHHSSLQLGEA
ncbi:hypothetical protein PN499_02205 [Kamptonema animale CS-326]|uniref:hypothetical protein n=1 Tax=Kamptonema animale TaxID=92934 RepID=UPI00232B2241|nr:hypothetical protein [Kamptonema animale]MDB9510020.1 hypothetical protein [Kamptonema animale CS-326]